MAISQEDTQSLINAVISALKTNSKSIEQLVPVSKLESSDKFEINGGRSVDYETLNALIRRDPISVLGHFKTEKELFERLNHKDVYRNMSLRMVSFTVEGTENAPRYAGILMQVYDCNVGGDTGSSRMGQYIIRDGLKIWYRSIYDFNRVNPVFNEWIINEQNTVHFFHRYDMVHSSDSSDKDTVKITLDTELVSPGYITYLERDGVFVSNTYQGLWCTHWGNGDAFGHQTEKGVQPKANTVYVCTETGQQYTVVNGKLKSSSAGATEAAEAAKTAADTAKTAANTAKTVADAAKALAEAAGFEVVRFAYIMEPASAWHVQDVHTATGKSSADDGCFVIFDPVKKLFLLVDRSAQSSGWVSPPTTVWPDWADSSAFGKLISSGMSTMDGGVQPVKHRLYIAGGAQMYVWDGEDLILFADLSDPAHLKSAFDSAGVKTFEAMWVAIGGELTGSSGKPYRKGTTNLTFDNAVAVLIESLQSSGVSVSQEDVNKWNLTAEGVVDLGVVTSSTVAFSMAAEKSITENVKVRQIRWRTSDSNADGGQGAGGTIFQERYGNWHISQWMMFEGPNRVCKVRTITTGGNYQVSEWQNVVIPQNLTYDPTQRMIRSVGPYAPGQGVTTGPTTDLLHLPLADEDHAGLMSNEDKVKLDGIGDHAFRFSVVRISGFGLPSGVDSVYCSSNTENEKPWNLMPEGIFFDPDSCRLYALVRGDAVMGGGPLQYFYTKYYKWSGPETADYRASNYGAVGSDGFVTPYPDRLYLTESGEMYVYDGADMVPFCRLPSSSFIGENVKIGDNVTISGDNLEIVTREYSDGSVRFFLNYKRQDGKLARAEFVDGSIIRQGCELNASVQTYNGGRFRFKQSAGTVNVSFLGAGSSIGEGVTVGNGSEIGGNLSIDGFKSNYSYGEILLRYDYDSSIPFESIILKEGTQIDHHAIIGPNVMIGLNSLNYENCSSWGIDYVNVYVGDGVRIGSDSVIGENVRIPEGFKVSEPMTVEDYEALAEYDDDMLYLLVNE